MSLSPEEVNHIANLARLRLTEDEKARYREQLSAILDHVAQLNELDTSSISPTSSVLPGEMPLRSDDPEPGLSLKALQQNAPQFEEAQFKLPAIFEQDQEPSGGEDGHDN